MLTSYFKQFVLKLYALCNYIAHFVTAKVPPQRQIASQHQTHDMQRDNVAIVGGQGQLSQQQQQQASLFLQQQQHRESPVTASAASTGQTESRSQERVAGYSYPAYQTVNPSSSEISAYHQHAAVYQNFLYPQLAAQQAFTSLAGGTAIRQSGIGEDSMKSATLLDCKTIVEYL